MATVQEEKYSPQSLECGICVSTFTDPKILQCLHSFCQKCVESHDVIGAGTNSIVCPLCRKPTPIPGEGVRALPNNLLLTNALDQLSVKSSKEYTLHCTNCEDESSATARCLECSEFLCSNCIQAHRRIRVTKDHRLVSMDTLQADKQSLHRPSFCPQHEDEVFMFYCLPCEGLICRECTILDHRGHKYAGLKEALEEKKTLVDELLSFCIEEKIPPVEDALHEVKVMTARLRKSAEDVKSEINAVAEDCIKRIMERRDEMMKQVDALEMEKEAVLESQEKELGMEMFKYTSSRDFVENVLLHGNESEIILLRDTMNTRLRELNGIQLDYKGPEENDVLDFLFDRNKVESISKVMGCIETTKTFTALCTANGLGIKSGKVGVESAFTIEVKDRFGNLYVEGTHCCPIAVTIKAPEGFLLGNHVTNNNDGTMRVRYTPVTSGKHTLKVMIRDREMEGSPFSVMVAEGIDYQKTGPIFMKFGSLGSKSSEFKQPCAVATDKEGYIYVADFVNCRVQRFDKLGKFSREFGGKGSKDGLFLNPSGLAVDSNGVVAVSDWDNHRIQLFSPEGKFIGKFGSKGSENGMLNHPGGLALTKGGNVAVVDKDNNRIQVFKLDGTFLHSFNGSEDGASSLLDGPSHLAVTNDNGFLVTDAGNNRVVKFDAKGDFQFSFGAKGSETGQLDRPSGIAVDSEGFVIVGDFQNHRVQVFHPDGKFFAKFGSEGDQEGQLKFPAGLALTPDGHIVVADRHNHRVQVF